MSETQIATAKFESGAVRSDDVGDFDFASAPLMGLLGVLKVAAGGGIKYGRHNYAKGMPVHVTLNHIAVHLIKYLLGDRTEDHLSKVAWGAMVANETALLKPELADPFLLGPGATLTAELVAEMDKDKAERDARREAGDFEELFDWTLGDIPIVQALINKRKALAAVEKLKALLASGVVGDVVLVPTDTIDPSFGPSSTNEQVYGTPTRTEPAAGKPTPRDGERWVEYDDGTRAYFAVEPVDPGVCGGAAEEAKPKRKRRTKAQIAADREAVLANLASESASVESATTPGPGSSEFDAADYPDSDNE